VIGEPLPHTLPSTEVSAERRLLGYFGERKAALSFLRAMAIRAVRFKSQPRRRKIQRGLAD
jgi:hypothetical protein